MLDDTPIVVWLVDDDDDDDDWECGILEFCLCGLSDLDCGGSVDAGGSCS